ncbi:GAF domain-containing protein [Actinoplanes sp. NPDC051851]|uniref:GAF domain-containing protein n=1 Tax=Actinoplanes sp. NPDC051851 TaxID=3154753 RepID=UPI00342161DB
MALRPEKALLSEAVQALAGVRALELVQRIVRRCARSLTGSHGATLVLREGDQCFYADEDAISPLWKGQRFPIAECISGWAMLNCSAAVVPDVRIDDRIPQQAYRPRFVRSMAMVPIRESAPIGAIGVYWAVRQRATNEQMQSLHSLAEAAGTALERLLVAPLPW